MTVSVVSKCILSALIILLINETDAKLVKEGDVECPYPNVGATRCPPSNALYYFYCCGNSNNDCCLMLQMWLVIVINIIVVISVIASILSIIRCIFCGG